MCVCVYACITVRMHTQSHIHTVYIINMSLHYVAVALAGRRVCRVPSHCRCLHNNMAAHHGVRGYRRESKVSLAHLVDKLVLSGSLPPPRDSGHLGCECHVARWRLPLSSSTAVSTCFLSLFCMYCMCQVIHSFLFDVFVLP